MDSTTTTSSNAGANVTNNPNRMVSTGYTATTNTLTFTSPGASITTNTMVSSAIHGGWPANPLNYTPVPTMMNTNAMPTMMNTNAMPTMMNTNAMPTMMNTNAAVPPRMYPSINRPMNLGQPYNMPTQPAAHYSNMVPYPFWPMPPYMPNMPSIPSMTGNTDQDMINCPTTANQPALHFSFDEEDTCSISTKEESELLKEDNKNYKDKVSLAYSILNTEPPVHIEEDPGLVPESRDDFRKVLFPIDDVLHINFKKAWRSISGNGKQTDFKKFSVEAPNNPSDSKFKKIPPSKINPRWYFIEGEGMESYSPERWPLKSWKLDEDFGTIFNVNQPKKDSTIGECMEQVGLTLKMINQSALFIRATQEAITALEPFIQEEGQVYWQALTDLLSVRDKTVSHLGLQTTNLQLNLLVKRREEELDKIKTLDNLDKKILKFAAPQSADGRIFGGYLAKWKEWKSQRDQLNFFSSLAKERMTKSSTTRNSGTAGNNSRSEVQERIQQAFRNQSKRGKSKNRGNYSGYNSNSYKGKGNSNSNYKSNYKSSGNSYYNKEQEKQK